MKWIALWIALLMLLPSCAGTGGAGCEAWRPILVAEADGLTEPTARAILARLGVAWTDLAPVLRAAAGRAHASRPMFWFADFHLSTFGHAEAARALLPVLAPDDGGAADGVVPE